MAFRTSEFLQRNELVRFQLDDVIRAPGNGQHQEKNGYTFTIMIDRVFMIGTMLISRFSSRYKNWLMVQPMVEIV